MTSLTRPTRRAAACAVALAFAGTGGAVAQADTNTPATTSLQRGKPVVQGSRPPVRGNYPGTYPSSPPSAGPRGAEAPVVQGSRPPVRGNYPATYVSAPSPGSSRSRFAWTDAALGASVACGAILLLAAMRAARARRHGFLRTRP